MRREVLREQGNEWCALQVELRQDAEGRDVLSICGSAGDIFTRKQAKAEALQYWESYFEEYPVALPETNEGCDTNFRSIKSAAVRSTAKHVLNTDGEYYGLDVHREEGNKVYITRSCGKIRGELLQYFPEVEPYLPWHLNNMRVSPERTELVTNAWGQTVTKVIPEGATWDYEPLPQHVIDWAKSL